METTSSPSRPLLSSPSLNPRNASPRSLEPDTLSLSQYGTVETSLTFLADPCGHYSLKASIAILLRMSAMCIGSVLVGISVALCSAFHDWTTQALFVQAPGDADLLDVSLGSGAVAGSLFAFILSIKAGVRTSSLAFSIAVVAPSTITFFFLVQQAMSQPQSDRRIGASVFAAFSLFGMGIGGISLLVPIYILDATAPHLTQITILLHPLMSTIGLCVCHGYSAALHRLKSNNTMNDGLVLVWFVLGVWIACVLMLPENPSYLIKHSGIGECDKSLHRLRPHVPEAVVETELNQRARESLQRNDRWQFNFDEVTVTTRRDFLMCFVMFCLLPLSGLIVIHFRLSLLFPNDGDMSSVSICVVILASQVLAMILSIPLSYPQRQRVFLVTVALMLMIMIPYAILHIVRPTLAINLWGTLASGIFLSVCYALGLGTYPWVAASRIQPRRLLRRSLHLFTSTNWALSAIAILVYSRVGDKVYIAVLVAVSAQFIVFIALAVRMGV